MTYNVVTTRQPQVIIDQATLQQLQTDLARRIADLERLRLAIETLAQVNDPDRFAAAAMAFCNQLASRWNAERASLGFLKGRYVRLAALSHTEKFTRQMRLVQDLEASMEECLDQDLEVLFPPAPQATYVSRSTEALATRHGPTTICSLPLRRGGDVVAVVTLERKADQPFSLDEVETLRLTCDLVTPRLVSLHDTDRWPGAKLAIATRKGLGHLVGPKHTWFKVAALAIFGLLAFAFLGTGTYKVDAPFSFEAIEKQVVPAPFDGQIKTVRVQVGDPVISQQTAAKLAPLQTLSFPLPTLLAWNCFDPTLATLRTEELEDNLAKAKADLNSYLKQAEIARSEALRDAKKLPEVQVNEALAQKTQAQIQLLEHQIQQATLVSSLDGIIFQGDLKQRLGAPVKTGDVLFEVGQLAALRAELSVPEDKISDLQMNLPGTLATASYPDQKINFTLERINPAAEVDKDKSKNIYKVRAKLSPQELAPWMRPGMEGSAQVHVRPERYAWLWTHQAVNWVRMKIWLYGGWAGF